jgi:hypothetical protein
MRKLIATTAFALAFGSGAFAAKPPLPSGGGPYDPKLGYVTILPSGARELRLANEDGTGSVKLASTPNHGQMTLSLGPRSSHKISYNDGGNLHLLTYEIGASGPRTVSDVVIVGTTSRGFGYHRFSPTGAQITYVQPGTNDIYLYNVGSGSSSLLLSVSDGYIGDLDFSHDGSQVIYSVTPSADFLTVGFRSVSVAGGSPTTLPITGKYGGFRVGHQDDRIVADTMGNLDGLSKLISADGSTVTSLRNGYSPDLRCDDAVVILQVRNGDKQATVSLLKYEIATGISTTFSRSGNYWPDYFPDC